MLSHVGLPKRFWVEAVNTASFFINRSPSSADEGKIPYEIWSGRDANLSYLRIFGYPAYYHVSKGKLELRAKIGIFVGYDISVKGYRVYEPDTNKVIMSIDVTFDERALLKDKSIEAVSPVDSGTLKQMGATFEVSKETSRSGLEIQLESTDQTDTYLDSPSSQDQQERSIARDRSRRIIQTLQYFKDGYNNMIVFALYRPGR